jgi:hypothetical protein
MILGVALVLATLGAVGITTAHAAKGVGGECHTTGKPGFGTVGCTGPSTASGGGHGIVPLDTMCTHKGCHSTGPNK